jgi:predicted DNA-binding ribbon-helix-helix protein
MSKSHFATRFPTTQWSRVARAGDPADAGARDALEGLCRDYWYPLYAFARRRGLDSEDACDLVQGFLADLIERGDLSAADRDRGRFRSFLRTACAHYLAHRREHDRALKRGGGRRALSIDRLDAEGRYGREPARRRVPSRGEHFSACSSYFDQTGILIEWILQRRTAPRPGTLHRE